ncbi:unnamed protein product [Vitrella brassicaformis CCMP3155]|uniref:Uncharacterized protein n=2 Tax=Vitrella brassicaformis TaxID=1169539 RepID=A0A0G4EWX7_VITBC|nr:unnamed protein product [Vitrella brassicaformis CCMP3155]|eukprot:CEM03009.1 unnamed protein product [Vitrella brassicaformis CCMP3155]
MQDQNSLRAGMRFALRIRMAPKYKKSKKFSADMSYLSEAKRKKMFFIASRLKKICKRHHGLPEGVFMPNSNHTPEQLASLLLQHQVGDSSLPSPTHKQHPSVAPQPSPPAAAAAAAAQPAAVNDAGTAAGASSSAAAVERPEFLRDASVEAHDGRTMSLVLMNQPPPATMRGERQDAKGASADA